jgi:hypothetical protein
MLAPLECQQVFDKSLLFTCSFIGVSRSLKMLDTISQSLILVQI